MKKSLWWIIGIAASPFVLFLILTLLLYCPPVQRWAVGIATQYASEETGMEISIDDVCLRFPLDLQLDGVKVIQRNDSLPQVKDTILNAQRVICEVQMRPLLDGNVQVDIMQMDGVQLNTTNFIPDCRVKGDVGRLLVTSHGIDLKRDTLMLNKVLLQDADIDVCLSDTAQKDTTETPNPDWILKFQNIDVKNTRILVHMPGDTLNIGADIAALNARYGVIDLQNGIYQIANADLNNSHVKYDNRFEPRLKNFDYNHIDISNLNLGIDNFYFKQNDIRLKLRACNAKEKCGLNLTSLTGDVCLDSTSVYVDALDLQTADMAGLPLSHIRARVDLDFNAFNAIDPGIMSADIDASIGKRDVVLLAGNNLPDAMMRRWPSASATLKGSFSGNMKNCCIKDVVLNVPTLARARISGQLQNLDKPDNLHLNTDLDVLASGGNGSIRGKASFGIKMMQYAANLSVNNLNIDHFVPGYGLGRFSGKLDVRGTGTDILSPRTMLNANISIGSFRYGNYDLSGATMNAFVKNGIAHADINSVSSIANGHVVLEGKVSKKVLNANVKADLHNMDFYALGMVKAPMTLALNGDLDINTDLNNNYTVRGRVGNICITDSTRRFTPNDIVVDAFTHKDTTHVDLACGDFMLNGNFDAGYKRLMSQYSNIIKEINHQVTDRVIDEMAIRSKFPQGSLRLRSGIDNPVARMIMINGYKFVQLDADVSVSPHTGLNGYVNIDTLCTEKIQLDAIALRLNSDAEKMTYTLNVQNGKDNPNYTFNADLAGVLKPNGTSVTLKVDDAKGRRGVDVGLEAMMEQDNIRISINKDKPILGYSEFIVNPDNYIRLSRDMRVSADMRLRSSKGIGIQVYTFDENTDALQDITLSINHLNIGELTQAMPFMPDIKGMMDGDFHLIVEKDKMSISVDADFADLVYQNCAMGNISTELVYMPLDDGSHHLDGVLFKDGEEVATIKGTYFFEGDDMIDAGLELTNMPMDLINGFIPNQIVGLKGSSVGKLTIKGYVAQPVINGELDLSQTRLISVPYGIDMKMDKKTVAIKDSRLILDGYRLTASNDSPLTIDGNINFSNIEHITTNLRIRGNNVEIIDAKETRYSEAYGKAFVNFSSTIQGTLDKLAIKGTLDVLPSTNLYYILRDSPITTDNRLKELVTFTDLTAEQQPLTQMPAVDGVSMDMNINVIEGSHVVCWLNNNHTNYVDITGNGELRFMYAQQKMRMTGRCTVSEGEMKYSLPVIPLKTFTISPDSYIEFKGDIMNPTLNITATERNRAAATVDGTETSVDFVCGVRLTKTLQDMGLEFIISAPENTAVNDQLNTISKEERGKLAVGMLTTGMYLDDRGGNFTMNSALNSFLQQEINNIAGNALRTLDLSIGVENSTTIDGNIHMDYSFKFAKRFWNNRVSISIGGKIATGEQTGGRTQSVFDNVEVQYRLSETSNQYLQLFYKHDVYDYLEGYLDHFGAGYLWKRKLQHISDLFRRKNVAEPTDTVRVSGDDNATE